MNTQADLNIHSVHLSEGNFSEVVTHMYVHLQDRDLFLWVDHFSHPAILICCGRRTISQKKVNVFIAIIHIPV